MYYLGRRLTGFDTSTEPLFILVASSNEDELLEFTRNIELLFNRIKKTEFLNLTQTSNRLELNANISSSLALDKGVILHRIDRLRADAPQVLHAMSDSASAPHKGSVLFGTLELPTQATSPDSCAYDVQR